jgi:NAD-dependent deacetylase
MPENKIDQYSTIARILKNSHHAVVFSGAGISTPSGIPDFRSANSGLWQNNEPMLVASFTAFKYHPDRFYRWLRPLLQNSVQAQPNAAHETIAELEKMGVIKAVITQNIDNLHQRAGSKNVIELHGTMERFDCPACHQPVGKSNAIVDEILHGLIPYCSHCGAIMKPDIVLYEEALPEQAWLAARDEIRQADVMIVAGSSLEVIPASSLPYDARQNGCRIIIINLTHTYMDSLAEVVLNEDVAEVFPQIFRLITEE